jgi:bifunctional N-acetylglucosamine-1-phosphate-uridyltransferase/glucosamine-1-phosphate-acetyltransferase GlmU-like protein
MKTVNLIPLAGNSKRFFDQGYLTPKQFIHIDGVPMFIKAALSLPKADKWIFVCLKDHFKDYKIRQYVRRFFPRSKILILKKKTEGQAATCIKAKKFINKNDILTIGACDNAMKFNLKKIRKKINNFDVVIWTFKDKKIIKKNPEMYGYVKVDHSEIVKKISCKKKLSSHPENDHAIIGAFSFRKADFFFKYTKKIIKKDKRVKNEFYLDTVVQECFKSKLSTTVNLVNKYYCWGTPYDFEKYIKKN